MEEHRGLSKDQEEPTEQGTGDRLLYLSEDSSNQERDVAKRNMVRRGRVLSNNQKVLAEDSEDLAPHLEAKISLDSSTNYCRLGSASQYFYFCYFSGFPLLLLFFVFVFYLFFVLIYSFSFSLSLTYFYRPNHIFM